MKSRQIQRDVFACLVCAASLLSCGMCLANDEDGDAQLERLQQRVDELSRDLDALRTERDSSVPAAERANSSTMKLGNGMEFEDPDGRWRFRVTSRVLADYRAFSPDVLAADTFSIRQARLGAQLSFDDIYTGYIEGEYAFSNAALTNAYLDIAFSNKVRMRFGQFKPSFGLEHSDRVPYFDFNERGLTASLVQTALFDRGVSVIGTPMPGMFYAVSLTNGTGPNRNELNENAEETTADGKDLTARLAMNFAEPAGWSDRIVHLGASYRTGEQANSPDNPYSAASGLSQGLGIVFFVPEAFNDDAGGVSASAVDRTLTGMEAIVAFGPVKLQSEVMQATYSGTQTAPAAVDYERSIEAGYLSATWLITGEHYRDAYSGSMITRIRPRADFKPGKAGNWGAFEAGVRYSWFDASDFSDSNPAFTGRISASGPATSSSPKADALTLGLKWILNTNVRFLFNYVRTRFDTPVIVNGESINDEKAVNLRAQFDLF